MNIKIKIVIITVNVICFLPISAQLSNNIINNRKDAENGAKPCKYESILRPSVLITPERLSYLKVDIRNKKSERRKIYEQYIKSDAELWLTRSIVVPQTGGWLHDFFCTDGIMLEIPDNKLFNDQMPSKCPECGKSYLNEKIISARRALIHYWYCGAIRNLALVYVLEGEEKYAVKALEILIAYAVAYSDQTILRQTLEEAVVLIPLAESYDLLFDFMSEAERNFIRDRLLWPAAQSLTKAGLGGNWGSWHLSAVGVIGYATRHQRFIDYAIKGFKDQIINQLGDDGLWPESVHTYHFYPLSAFLSFVEAATNYGDNLYLWEDDKGKGLKKMLTSPLKYMYPDMRLAAINDGWYNSFLPQDQYLVGYYRYRLPEFAWAVLKAWESGKSGMSGDLLDYHYRNVLYGVDIPKYIPKPLLQSTNFSTMGISILRQGYKKSTNDEIFMTFDYGPFLGHGHPDKMGITLFAKGELLVADYGTTGYASTINQFLKSTYSHNTVIIDGKNHPPTKDRNLTEFIDSEFLQLASAYTQDIETGVDWTRTIIMLNDYIVIHDKLNGKTNHQYDWLLHAEGEKLSVEGDSIKVYPGEFNCPYLSDMKKWNVNQNTGYAYWENNNYGLGLWFDQAGSGQSIYTALMPTGQGSKKVSMLSLRQEDPQAEFIAVLIPMKGLKEKKRKCNVQFTHDSKNQLTVKVSLGGQDEYIFLKENEIKYTKRNKVVLHQQINLKTKI